jgi:hypothetical protein
MTMPELEETAAEARTSCDREGCYCILPRD